MHRSAEQTDTFMNRTSESEKVLEPEDRKGLRLSASTLKDVVAVGRDTYQLSSRDEGQMRCLVNLAFLQSFEPPVPEFMETIATEPTSAECATSMRSDIGSGMGGGRS